MTTSDPSRRTRSPGGNGHGDGPEGPSVGNVLGFSLLFRERKALLALTRRGVAPGVRVRDYEAEIPNVSFPLKGALQAARFRHRRCRAVQATVVVETRALVPWLEARLHGASLAGMRVEQVELDLRATVPGTRTPRPTLGLGGRAADGGVVWMQVAFGIEPDGRHLRLRPTHRWLFGDLPPLRGRRDDGARATAADVWRAALPRLRGGIAPQPDGSVLVDIARLVLTDAFVRTGWKSPDLSALGIETVALGRRSVTVELREQDDEIAVPVDPNPEDPIGDALARVHAHRDDPMALDDLLDALRQISASLEALPSARLACVKWAVQMSRFHDRAACLSALRSWLDLRPTARPARRMLATTLARAGFDRELAQLLVADRRSAATPRSRALLDLALATLLVERLDEPRSALAILRPLTTHLRETDADPLGDLLPRALVVLAQARVVDAAIAGARAAHAEQALEEALSMVEAHRSSRRADMRASVARTFARHGELGPALSLMSRALADDPTNEEHLDLAIELSLGLGERESAVELLRVRIRDAPRDQQLELRHRLLGVLADVDDPEYVALTRDEVERALERDPDAVEILELATRVERRAGNLAAAAEYLGRIEELEADADRKLDLAIDRAELLRDARLLDAAWDAARTALRVLDESDLYAPQGSGTPPDPRIRPALELALDLAPPTARAELLDRYVQFAEGESLGRALIERAETRISAEEKLADLIRAAAELEDPSEVLRRIEHLAGDDLVALDQLVRLAESRNAPAAASSARARLGAAALQRGDFANAIDAYERALEATPDQLALRPPLAESLERAGRLRDALDVLRPLLDAPEQAPGLPPLPNTARKLATLAADVGDDEAALEFLMRARAELISRAADNWTIEQLSEELFGVLYRLGHVEQAEDLAAEMLTRTDERRRPHWLLQAAIVGTGDARLERLREAAELAPRNADVADGLEAELRARGLQDELRHHLRRRLAVLDAPTERAAVLERLVALIESDSSDPKERRELADLLSELLGLLPDHVDALLTLAQLRHSGGAEQEALILFRRAEGQLESDDPRMFVPALRLGLRALQGDLLDDAEPLLRRAIALEPSATEPLAALHELGRRRDDPRAIVDAIDGLLRATEDRAKRAELELELARAHIELEEGALAFDRLKRAAAEVEPRSALHLEIAETWLDLARRRNSRPEEGLARGQLRRALGLTSLRMPCMRRSGCWQTTSTPSTRRSNWSNWRS